MFNKILYRLFGFRFNYKPYIVVRCPLGKDKEGKEWAIIAEEMAKHLVNNGGYTILPSSPLATATEKPVYKWDVETIGKNLEVSIGWFWIAFAVYGLYRLAF